MVTIEFSVMGESMEDPGHFLLVDDDGQYYDYEIASGIILPIEMDTGWVVDPEPCPPELTEHERRLLLAS